MHSLLVLVAAATLGVEVGWEPLPEGGHEYTIQLEPQLLHVLQRGNDLVSDVPPQLHIRRYRVTVGTGKLAQVNGEPAQPNLKEIADDPTEPELPLESTFPRVALPDETPDRGEEHAASDNHARTDPDMPSTLPDQLDAGELPKRAGYNESEAEKRDTEKPALPPGAGATSESESGRPWLPLFIAALLLCCSLGGNVYLGWIAWHAHGRYRDAVAKFRVAPTG